MPWHELRITSWQHFLDEVVEKFILVSQPLRRSYVFRGQAKASWSLIPALTRVLRSRQLTATQALDLEHLAVKRFRENAHLLLEPHWIDGANQLDWWTLMQHHGAPTRVLDWSHSPLVGLYFAVIECPEDDGAVWAFHRRSVTDAAVAKYGDIEPIHLATNFEQLFCDPVGPLRLAAFDRGKPTARMVAQQGAFTVSCQILADHHDCIDELLGPREEAETPRAPGIVNIYRSKYIIPAALKQSIGRRLQAFNVRADALFPGIDGLGKSIAELIRLSD